MPSIELLKKGTFKKIDTNFLTEGHEILEEVSKVQEKFHKEDTDTFINELRDSIAGYYLGYNLVNIEKHGFDCKMSEEQDIFLEVKSASFSAKSWGATFNDTNMEKARCFKEDNVYLCLAVWKNASNLLFCCYGRNKNIGLFLENRVQKFLSGNGGVRCTQTLNIKELIFDYDFDVVCVNKNKDEDEVKQILILKNRKFLELSDNKILSLTECKNKYEYCSHNT